jgi:heme o synthase
MTPRARRFALATAVATFVLLLVGGLVNPTGSSLACPDWPLCHGSAFPAMLGGVLYEHSHRLAATAVGILTVVLALVLRREGRGRLGAVAVAAVVVQGCLGGATVLLRLPPLVSIAHLALSMAFFAYLVGLAVPRRVDAGAATHRALAAAALLVYLQIVLGAVVRHTYSALACANELPGCFGQLWPAGASQQIHMAHRLFGVLVAAVVATTGVACARRLRGGLRLLALALPVLVLLQIGLGVWTVLTLKALVPVELHLAVGALLLAVTTTLAVATRAGNAMPVVGPLLELTKPRITVLSVITTAAGLALAPGRASIGVALALIAGTALIVGSANTLNMYLERDVDARMARTRRRPLPSGRLGAGVALWFGLVQGLIGVPLLVFGANALTGLLGALALVIYVLVYTPMKRHSVHALLVGAIPGAMPPLLGWTAGAGSISAGGLMLFAVLFLWQIPHFLAIALFRRRDYLAAGLKVLPNERGEDATRRAIFVTLVLQVLATLALVPLGLGGPAYLVGAAVLGAVMLGWGALGLIGRRDDAWARRLFGISVAYLPALFAILLVS